MTEVVPVTTARLVREFVELPYSLYADHSHWVPPLRRDEHRRLSRKHNPFLEHADMSLWLARSNGRVTGRIAAIDDRLHNEAHHEHVTWFGFFEAEDAATANVLLKAVEACACARGSTAVRGPVNPSLNESAGVLIDCFDEDPYVLMPYNPPHYPAYLESAGYRKVKDLLAWSIDLTAPLPQRIAKIAERVRARHHLVVRPIDLQFFERDLASIQQIYRDAWQENWGFVPPTDAEVRQLAADLRPVLDTNLVLLAEMAGRAVACAVSLPDINQVLKRMNGGLLPFGIIHFLRRKKIVNQARLILLGVVSEMRRIGLYPLLIAESYTRAVARGYVRAELSWTLEDNDLVNRGIEAVGGRRHKTYRLYEKPVG